MLALQTINKGKDLHIIGKVCQQVAAHQPAAPPLLQYTEWRLCEVLDKGFFFIFFFLSFLHWNIADTFTQG